MRNTQFVNNGVYHIFNRGVDKRDIFQNDGDKWRFLQGLFIFNDNTSSSNLLWRLEDSQSVVNFRVIREFFRKNPKTKTPFVKIYADSLMPNHFHLILEQLIDGGISKFLHKLSTGYTMYFNKKYERVGSLFQGPFKAINIGDDLYLQYLLVYLNVINPAQFIEPKLKEEGTRNIDKILKFAGEYNWSTHKEYAGLRDSMIIDKGILGEIFDMPEKYLEFAKRVLETKKYNAADHLFLE